MHMHMYGDCVQQGFIIIFYVQQDQKSPLTLWGR